MTLTVPNRTRALRTTTGGSNAPLPVTYLAIQLRLCLESVFYLLFSILGLALALSAQTPDTATLRGQVTDPAHAAVSGAKITATTPRPAWSARAETDAAGGFSLAGLPVAGTWRITAVKQGFAEAAFPACAGRRRHRRGQARAQRRRRTDPDHGHRRGGRGPHRRSRNSASASTRSRWRTRRCSTASITLPAAAQRRQPPRHQPGRRVHEPEPVHHQRRGPPPDLVRGGWRHRQR